MGSCAIRRERQRRAQDLAVCAAVAGRGTTTNTAHRIPRPARCLVVSCRDLRSAVSCPVVSCTHLLRPLERRTTRQTVNVCAGGAAPGGHCGPFRILWWRHRGGSSPPFRIPTPHRGSRAMLAALAASRGDL